MPTVERSPAFQAFVEALGDERVMNVARRLREGDISSPLVGALEVGKTLAELVGDARTTRALRAEVDGYEAVGLEVPRERRVTGFASPFAVRALGMLDPEEIFLANREKFSQVTLTIGQPIRELEVALEQIEAGGVLALKVPASEVSGEAANTDADTEVFIYILPREIERIINAARQRAMDAIVLRVMDGLLGPRVETDVTDPAVPLVVVEDTDVHRVRGKKRQLVAPEAEEHEVEIDPNDDDTMAETAR